MKKIFIFEVLFAMLFCPIVYADNTPSTNSTKSQGFFEDMFNKSLDETVIPIQVQFKLVEDDADKDNLVFGKKVLFDEDDIVSAEYIVEDSNEVLNKVFNNPALAKVFAAKEPKKIKTLKLKFTDSAARKLTRITTKYKGNKLGVFVDGKLLKTSVIREPITSGVIGLVGDWKDDGKMNFIAYRLNKRKE
ncbi:MAG: hypothetical protein HQL29_01945 [Candidatus Omnitrophica bacterium]|nr:hypothetical protein [Candidatus Omnitrophota bacterium]